MAKKRLPRPPENLADETKDLYDAINGDSAIAAVLIGASALEQAVGSILGRFFTEGSTSERLLDHKGPLAMLFQRASVAYSLGLISLTTFNNLQAIGEVRNLFAHSHLHMDFDNPEVIDQCRKLQTIFYDMPADDGKPHQIAEIAKNNMASRFVLTVVMTFNTMLVTALGTERRPVRTGA